MKWGGLRDGPEWYALCLEAGLFYACVGAIWLVCDLILYVFGG